MFQTGIKSSSGKKRWQTKKEQPKEQKSFLSPRPLPSIIRKYISVGKVKSSCLFVVGPGACLLCALFPSLNPYGWGGGPLRLMRLRGRGGAKVMVCSLPGFELTIF